MNDHRLRWLIVAMTALMVGLQLGFPSRATLLIPPLVITATILAVYWNEIKTYSWAGIRTKDFALNTFYAATQGIIAQAAGIVLVVHVLGVEEPKIGLAITPFVVFNSTFVSAILEEVVYRKILFGVLDKRFGFWPAAVVSSLLFAVSHYNYAAHLGYFLLGLVWCRAYKKTGDLGVVIAGHTLFNAVSFIIRFLRE